MIQESKFLLGLLSPDINSLYKSLFDKNIKIHFI